MNNEFIELIKTRHSVRSFSDEPIPADVLKTIAETAVYAPSAMNRQCWHFTVLTNRDEMAVLAEALKKAGGLDERYCFYRPAALIIASADRDIAMGRDDFACALENIFLAAHALGVGSVWINQLRDFCDVPEVRALLHEYGVPDGHAVYGSAALGYAKKPPRITEKFTSNITYR